MSLDLVLASLYTCTAGDVESIVPVYFLPSLVYITQYSPSNVGVIGPPKVVNANLPFGLIERTINPKVSQCADVETSFDESLPFIKTSKVPLFNIFDS